MFNACRLASASLSRRIAASAISRSAVCKQSILTLGAGKLNQRTIADVKSFHSSSIKHQYAAESPIQDGDRESSGELITKFQDLADKDLVHPAVIDRIVNGMGYENMTRVQSLTINETLKGTDIIAQAKTGTGKTLGFLIPVVQNILGKSPELAKPSRRHQTTASDIRAIIMSPTRELAEQIGVEAQKLVGGTGLKVQVAVGGNNKRFMLMKTQREGCHILVATPGRLKDLLSDQYSRIAAPNLGFFVLDEADRMLDAGFSEEIADIMRLLPDRQVQDRQTLLFSATVPREVMGLVRKTLKHDFKFMQTVQKGEVETHQKVPQKLAVVNGLENVVPTILELAKRELQTESALPFKAIIYFNCTAMVDLTHEIFMNLKQPSGHHPLGRLTILKINAKMSQEARSRSAERFRREKTGILISTDVTARGMDFPNVSHVIQAGLAADRQQYIHRIGRTGRGDKQGEAWLLAVKGEEARAVPRHLHDLPIVPDNSLEVPKVDMTRDAQVPDHVATTLREASDASKQSDRAFKASAYVANLGIFSAFGMRKVMPLSTFVQQLNQLAIYGWGMEEPPFVSPMLAQKMGARGSDGLNIGKDFSSPTSSRYGSDRSERSGYGAGRGGGGYSSRGSGDRESGFGGRGRDEYSSRESRDSKYAPRARGGFASRGSGGRDGGFGGRGRDAYSSRDGGSRDSGFSSRGRGGFSGGRGRGGFSDREGGRSRDTYSDRY